MKHSCLFCPGLLVLLSYGCATLPTSPIPPGVPTSVTFVQAGRGASQESIVLRLSNRAGIQGERPQDLATKLCPDPDMANLLAALAASGFFEAARPGPPAMPTHTHLEVTSTQGGWTLARPSSRGPEGRLPGEELGPALQRFQTCSGLMLTLYNNTFDLVPLEVEDGKEYFRELQEKARQAGRDRAPGR